MRRLLVVAAVAAGIVLMYLGSFAGSSETSALAESPSECDAASAPPDSPAAAHYTQAQISRLWVEEGGPADQAQIAGAVGMAESGGDAHIVNSIGASGLMQIHPPEPGVLDPHTNMRIAVRKYTESKASRGDGWLPWETYTNGDYLQYIHERSVPIENVVPANCVTDPGGPVLDRLVREADRMIAFHKPYVWGGGHGPVPDPDGPWDCSGAVSQLAHALGYLNGTLTSTGFMTQGKPGRGRDWTIYSNAGHVFIIVEAGEHKGDAWGTATEGAPAWHHHTTSGFTARHYGADLGDAA